MKTIPRWRHVYQRLGLPRVPDNPARLCPMCGDRDLLDEEAYALLLGWYLGDGSLALLRRGVYVLQVDTDNAYPGLMDEIEQSMRRVKPRGSVHRTARKGCKAIKMQWKHWPCVFPQHGPGGSTTERLPYRTGSRRSWIGTLDCFCVACSTAMARVSSTGFTQLRLPTDKSTGTSDAFLVISLVTFLKFVVLPWIAWGFPGDLRELTTSPCPAKMRWLRWIRLWVRSTKRRRVAGSMSPQVWSTENTDGSVAPPDLAGAT